MRDEVLKWRHSSGDPIWEPYLELFKTAPVSDEEFSHLVSNSSKNFERHIDSHFNPVRKCLNSIHNKKKFIEQDLSKVDYDFLNDNKINFKRFLLRLEQYPISQETINNLIKSPNKIASYEVDKHSLLIVSIVNQLHMQEKYLKPEEMISVKDFVTGKTINYDLDELIIKSENDKPQIRRDRLKIAPKFAEKIKVTSVGFNRNPDVIVEVLIRSQGVCERCDKRAPFIRKKDNTPYLEVHHKIMLSNGGEDTVENAIALCPNCHREIHFGIQSG